MSDTPQIIQPKAIPAFYKHVPPRIVPLLHSQTEILLHDHSVPTLMAHEERTVTRSSGVIRSRPHSTRSEPYAKAVTFRLSTPTATPVARSTIKTGAMSKSRSASPLEEDSDLSGSEESQVSYDSDNSTQSQVSASDDFRIPKPVGEVGRPGSGGYNLREQLGLPKNTFDAIKVLHFQFRSCPYS
jgi:hypothetical protein